MKVRTCTACGCTDDRACCGPLPCSWVSRRPPLCSGCLLFLMNVRDPAKLAKVVEALGIAPAGAVAVEIQRQHAKPAKKAGA